MTMRFTLDGESFDLTPEQVRSSLTGQTPEVLRNHWVDVDGTKWPVKQVISLATGVTNRKRFRSRASRRWLYRLGFELGSDPGRSRLESPSKSSRADVDVGTLQKVDTVDISVTFNWLDAGSLQLDPRGFPMFPALPRLPGMYRFDFGRGPDGIRTLYVGESKNLERRSGQYRNAKRDRTRPRRTSRRIHKELVAHLAGGGTINFAIAVSARLGDSEVLDLRFKSARCLAENAAVVLARSEPRTRMLNIDAEFGDEDSEVAAENPLI